MADLQYHEVDQLHSVHGWQLNSVAQVQTDLNGILSYLAKREPKAAGLRCALTAATKSPGVGLRQDRVSQVPKRGQRETMDAWLERNNDMELA